MFDEIVIREMTHADERAVNEFFDSMGGESRALFNRRDYNRKNVLKFLQNPDKTRRYWIAELDGMMAGYVFFLDYNTTVPTMGIALRDDLKGKHLGRRLVGFLIERAEADGKGGIQVTTHIANLRGQALYEAMGFRQLGVCKNGTELFYLYRYCD